MTHYDKVITVIAFSSNLYLLSVNKSGGNLDIGYMGYLLWFQMIKSMLKYNRILLIK